MSDAEIERIKMTLIALRQQVDELQRSFERHEREGHGLVIELIQDDSQEGDTMIAQGDPQPC